MRVPSPTMAVIEMPWLERKYEPLKPVEVTSTMPPIPVEANAPPDLVTPLTASAAASASQARRSRSDVEGNQRPHEMCPIHADFKHVQAPKAKEVRECRKLSSIM